MNKIDTIHNAVTVVVLKMKFLYKIIHFGLGSIVVFRNSVDLMAMCNNKGL